MTKIMLKKLAPEQKKSASLYACRVVSAQLVRNDTRSPSLPLKNFIYKRDQGTCTYVSPVSGKRCTSRHALQIDHITPYALGGKTLWKSI